MDVLLHTDGLRSTIDKHAEHRERRHQQCADRALPGEHHGVVAQAVLEMLSDPFQRGAQGRAHHDPEHGADGIVDVVAVIGPVDVTRFEH